MAYIVVLAQRGVATDPETGKSLGTPAEPFTARFVEAESEEEAGKKTGGHFVHVYPDKGEDSIVHEEDGVKHALLVLGRPAPTPKGKGIAGS